MNGEFKRTVLVRIPKDWDTVKLGHYVELETGKRAKGGGLSEGDIPSLGGEHIDEAGRIVWENPQFITKEFYNTLKHGKIMENDILLVKDGATTGKVAFIHELIYPQMAVNEHIFIVRAKSNSGLFSRFLFYVLLSDIGQKQIKSTFHGIIGGIRREEIASFLIPLPPFLEQKKIAEILSTVDEAIEKVDKLIKKTERLKKGLMEGLLSGRLKAIESESEGQEGQKGQLSLRVREPEEFKDSPIGKIPKEWEVVQVGRLFELEYGEGLSEKERVVGDYPVYGSNGVIGYHKQFMVQGPGIVIGRKGSIGTVTWVNTNFWPIDTTYYVKLKTKSIHLRWLYFKLLLLNLSKLNMATGIPGLNRNLVYGLKLVLPTCAEQQKHVEILCDIDSQLMLLVQKKKKFERIKQVLMNDLLTGKRRVKLGGTDEKKD